ncbi:MULTISPECIES: leucine zipper domain-containing protein [Streptosporangium]|uniref:GNAT family N-acetyltransferase n=1 Tax=Streptosporangium brasiliense TaxID=47480 RepID=A0ABT9R0E5_9ACTN|nr:leucine zipper domain-containing protein [Streptosporangium brasiliense]MDP9861965.1 hypothetical protein [Streptosporangium brasiliense]
MEITVLTRPEVFTARADARLTGYGRAPLTWRVRSDGRPVAHVAEEPGVPRSDRDQ